MKDPECVSFLQWALPQLHMRWPGFRKVRNQVCKRLSRRLVELGMADSDSYRQHLKQHPDEWKTLDSLCRVVVSRYYRDKVVFAKLTEQVLPDCATAALADGRKTLHCWSVGSASGEEPYTLAIIWPHLLAPRFPSLEISILATEADPHLLERSKQACYPASTLKNLPQTLRTPAFSQSGDRYCLQPAYRSLVDFRQQDIRTTLPDDCFDLILCRNLVFTYFDEPLQLQILNGMLARLRPRGWLVLGVRETLPARSKGMAVVSERLGLYRKEQDNDGALRDGFRC